MTVAFPESAIPRASANIYYLIHRLFRGIVRLTLKHEVLGLEHMPKAGPFLLVSNHLSVTDPIILFINSPHRMVMFVADKWRRAPGVSHLSNTLGCIWVTRGEADTEAIKTTLAVLKSGGIIGMAPEGTRSHTGGLIQGKVGAAFLADRAKVPVLPMAVWGTEDIWPSWKRLRRPVVTCAIGRPFQLPTDGRAKGQKLEEYTDLLMCRIAALLPPQYRGVYRDHPLLAEVLRETTPG